MSDSAIRLTIVLEGNSAAIEHVAEIVAFVVSVTGDKPKRLEDIPPATNIAPRARRGNGYN